MPTPTKGPRLGGGPAHERIMLANLAQSLFEHRRIKTTEAKAKRLRPLAERLVTFAKRGDLASRRRVMSVISDKGVVHSLFTEIAPLVAERPGGYTRIVKTTPRKGDNAPMAIIELVLDPYSAKVATVKEAEAATRRSAAPAAAAPATEAAASDEAATTDVPAEPVADEAATADVTSEVPVADEATTDEAATDEAATDEATTDEVATADLTTEEAVADEAAASEAGASEAEAGEPEAKA